MIFKKEIYWVAVDSIDRKGIVRSQITQSYDGADCHITFFEILDPRLRWDLMDDFMETCGITQEQVFGPFTYDAALEFYNSLEQIDEAPFHYSPNP